MIKFTIPGTPKGKGRPRLGKFATYTPKDTVEYENWVKMCFVDQVRNHKPTERAIQMTIWAHFEIPRSVSKTKHEQMSSWYIKPTKKPDIDNIVKAICDSLNGIAWKDDSQITSLTVHKVYSEEPCVNVEYDEV